MKYGVSPKTNLIVDHSFELVRPLGNVGSGGYWTNWESDEWLKSGSPRLFRYYGTDVAIREVFGYRCIGVNNSNYVYMDLYEDLLTAGKTFTFSCHFANYTGSPSPRLRARLMRYTYATDATTIINTWNQTFAPITKKGKLQRHSITITLPSDFDGDELKYYEWIEFSIMSGNSSWLIIDGAQVVEGSYSTLYEEESSLWSLVNGVGEANYFITRGLSVIDNARAFGTLKLQNASGTSNALEFPSGHMISTSPTAEDFTFYGNRAGGRKPFVLRTHSNTSNYRADLYVDTDGTLYSTPTYNTTSSNAANVRIGIDSDGESRFLRTSSAKKYKHDIQLSDVDPYKILDLEIKSWYDKREYEENGESTDGLRRYHALVADDVADVLPEFADYNHEGEVENYNDRVFSLLIPIVKELKERIDEIESKCKCGR